MIAVLRNRNAALAKFFNCSDWITPLLIQWLNWAFSFGKGGYLALLASQASQAYVDFWSWLQGGISKDEVQWSIWSPLRKEGACPRISCTSSSGICSLLGKSWRLSTPKVAPQQIATGLPKTIVHLHLQCLLASILWPHYAENMILNLRYSLHTSWIPKKVGSELSVPQNRLCIILTKLWRNFAEVEGIWGGTFWSSLSPQVNLSQLDFRIAALPNVW